MDRQAKDCIHCGRCTALCPFLKKYHLDLGDYAHRPDLSYHCFLCGACGRSCPRGIDGRALTLTMRRQQVDAGHRPERDGYCLLLMEKRDYIFKNYRRGGAKSVLFPGCNFAGYYPKTTRYLAALLREKAGMGTVFDCCARPVFELGLQADAIAHLRRMEGRLASLGAEEIVVVCPNCYDHLRNRIGLPVISIYDKLSSLGFHPDCGLAAGALFRPCPDRDTGQWAHSIGKLLPIENLAPIGDIPCCGAGGCAGVKEPALAADMLAAFDRCDTDRIYTYCGTCAGRIAGSGAKAEHLLCRLLGQDEIPARGMRSLVNRASFSFK